MDYPAFVVFGDQAALVANDGAELRYRAHVHHILPGEQAPVHSCAARETFILVQRGTVEFMVDGASDFVPEGQLVRIAPAAHYAWRNCGEGPATLLIRAARPRDQRCITRLVFEYAAA
jgi:mannose-6-phosphate isomerase-like protein (cupin superfamily)